MTTDLVPHLLKLVDPGPGVADYGAVAVIGSLLGTGREGWVAVREEAEALVFPSWLLAHRFARRFMAASGQSWMPAPAPDREPTIPRSGQSCRGCGCTESFACPGRCTWIEPDLCSECAKGEELVTWVIYDKPTDFPESAIARKFIGGVPTPEHLAAGSLEKLREAMPPGAFAIPRAAGDPKSVVEVWV